MRYNVENGWVHMIDEMTIERAFSELEHGDNSVSARASHWLNESFEENAGDKLVTLLLDAPSDRIFFLICDAVIPKWIVKLERSLSRLSEWPLSVRRTIWLVRICHGYRLPALEKHIARFLTIDDWCLRLAAVQYCHDKQVQTDLARSVCFEFLSTKWASPSVKQELAKVLRFSNFRALSARIRLIAKEL